MSFGDHLEELRTRLIAALLGLVPILILSLSFGGPLMNVLMKPAQAELREQGLAETFLSVSPAETFGVYMKVSLLATVILGSPWLLYQMWLFVAPGLYKHEQRFIHVLLPLSTLLTIASAFFMYFVLLPVILAFFMGFGTQLSKPHVSQIDPGAIVLPRVPVLSGDPIAPASGEMWIDGKRKQLRVNIAPEGAAPEVLGMPLTKDSGIVIQPRLTDYFKWLTVLGIGFALAFQTPVVVLLLGWSGAIDVKTIAKYRKHAILGAFVVGAVLTPPDPVSQPLLSIPIYLLYELGILLLKVMPAKKMFKTESEMEGEPDEG
jgi:sec-independent protein translocase protein TatC